METKNNFCKTPCIECPFKKSSIKGYLGGFTIEETLQAASSDQDFLCHMHGRGENKKQCAGRMLYATKTAKMFRTLSFEKIRKEIADLNPNFRDEILGFDFKSHHTV